MMLAVVIIALITFHSATAPPSLHRSGNMTFSGFVVQMGKPDQPHGVGVGGVQVFIQNSFRDDPFKNVRARPGVSAENGFFEVTISSGALSTIPPACKHFQVVPHVEDPEKGVNDMLEIVELKVRF
ncbi:hypothetical protein DdX_14683 [Ditylenchus destructor]|uniref:Uncharacterized protein n=1 Tax=Ditylenchus destructor TaxID=166010 RepID=A0AAD4R1G7_9BILA|nr:hypothetical protein DdX_14683 [Ditylenchus destructor]